MPVQVNIAGSENKAASELKRILAQLVLPVSSSRGPFPRLGIVAAQKMQERALQQADGAISLPLGVDQKWEADSSLLAKNLSVVSVAETNGSQPRTFVSERLFVAAQLRDVLAAEYSSVVAQEHNHSWAVGPERAKAHQPSGRVGQNDLRELCTYR